MSASPLPAIPMVTPTPAPSNVVPSQSNQGSNTAFGTHLQNAQRQQDSSNNADTEQGDSNQSASTPANAQATNTSQADTSAKPGADPSGSSAAQTDGTDSDSDALSIPTSIGSLASTVLSLIDQATGDADSNSAPASGGKSASNSTAHAQVPSAAAQAAVFMPTPPPVAPAASAASKGSNSTNTDTGIAALSSNSNAAGSNQAAVQSALGSQNPNGANNTGFASADDADSGYTGAVSATGDSAASLQNVGDSAQALSSLLTGSHAASTSASALPGISTSTTSTNSPDLTALRGIADATAVAAPSGNTGTSTHGLSVNAPVGSSGFAKELGQQVTWLSGQEVKQAQIRLNPQDLGPLDVKVSVDHGRVDVAFMTQHPATATAVQQGLDQLNQMLGGQGLSLGHTSVGQQSAQQQFAGQQQAGTQTTSDADNSAENTAVETLQRVAVGLVDAFA